MGALKRVLSCLSPGESKGLLISTQLIAKQLPQVEVVIQLPTRIVGLEVESMHTERIKVQLLE